MQYNPFFTSVPSLIRSLYFICIYGTLDPVSSRASSVLGQAFLKTAGELGASAQLGEQPPSALGRPRTSPHDSNNPEVEAVEDLLTIPQNLTTSRNNPNDHNKPNKLERTDEDRQLHSSLNSTTVAQHLPVPPVVFSDPITTQPQPQQRHSDDRSHHPSPTLSPRLVSATPEAEQTHDLHVNSSNPSPGSAQQQRTPHTHSRGGSSYVAYATTPHSHLDLRLTSGFYNDPEPAGQPVISSSTLLTQAEPSASNGSSAPIRITYKRGGRSSLLAPSHQHTIASSFPAQVVTAGLEHEETARLLDSQVSTEHIPLRTGLLSDNNDPPDIQHILYLYLYLYLYSLSYTHV